MTATFTNTAKDLRKLHNEFDRASRESDTALQNEEKKKQFSHELFKWMEAMVPLINGLKSDALGMVEKFGDLPIDIQGRVDTPDKEEIEAPFMDLQKSVSDFLDSKGDWWEEREYVEDEWTFHSFPLQFVKDKLNGINEPFEEMRRNYGAVVDLIRQELVSLTKSATLNCINAVEVSCKVVLFERDPSFIFENSEEFSYVALRRCDFKTVDFETGINLLGKLGIGLPLKSIQTLRNLRHRRNKLQHFIDPVTVKVQEIMPWLVEASFICVWMLSKTESTRYHGYSMMHAMGHHFRHVHDIFTTDKAESTTKEILNRLQGFGVDSEKCKETFVLPGEKPHKCQKARIGMRLPDVSVFVCFHCGRGSSHTHIRNAPKDPEEENMKHGWRRVYLRSNLASPDPDLKLDDLEDLL